MAKSIIALYDNVDNAHRAVRDLVDYGFDREGISLMTQDRRQAEREMGTVEEDTVSEGAGAGAGVGALVGGLGGLLVGLGALAIPGIGPLLVAGPLVTTLAGAGVGAGLGALVGALAGMGVPEEEARYYAEGVRRGGTLVTVRSPDDRAPEAVDIMERYNPVDVDQRAAEWRAEGWAGAGERERPAGVEGMEVPRERWAPDYDIHERGMTGEPLDTGYRERGITREPAESERYDDTTVYRATDEPEDIFGREDEDMLYGTGSTEDVEQTYRNRSEVPSSGMGGAGAGAEEWGDRVGGGAGMPHADYEGEGLPRTEQDFTGYEPFYRSHFQQVFGSGVYDYERMRSAYYFGYSLSQDPHFRGKSWNDIEGEARQEWEDQYELFWNEVSEAVYEGWRVPTAIGSREIGH
jgi:hypothetical protein